MGRELPDWKSAKLKRAPDVSQSWKAQCQCQPAVSQHQMHSHRPGSSVLLLCHLLWDLVTEKSCLKMAFTCFKESSEQLCLLIETTRSLLPCVIPSTEPPQTPQHTAAPARRRAELTFEDDGDDLMDALGFGSGPKDEKQGKKAEE